MHYQIQLFWWESKRLNNPVMLEWNCLMSEDYVLITPHWRAKTTVAQGYLLNF